MKHNEMQVPADHGVVMAVSLILLLNDEKHHKCSVSLVCLISILFLFVWVGSGLHMCFLKVFLTIRKLFTDETEKQ